MVEINKVKETSDLNAFTRAYVVFINADGCCIKPFYEEKIKRNYMKLLSRVLRPPRHHGITASRHHRRATTIVYEYFSRWVCAG